MSDKYEEYKRQYRIDHKEQYRNYSRQWYQRNKKKVAAIRRKHKIEIKYGITLEEYDRMYNQQDGKCAICHTHQKKLIRRLSVDHNHLDNKIRGLLCDKCNVGIGFFDDNTKLLQKAINYINKYKQIDII